MVKLRLNEVLKAHGMLQKELAEKMGIKPISLSQMLGRGTFGVDRLEEMANIIGCKITELFEEETTNDATDFASYVRFHGIHFTADDIREFLKQVEEIKIMAKV